MTVYEKLNQEFSCAITAIFGDLAEKDESEIVIDEGDIDLIAKKVKFYLFQ